MNNTDINLSSSDIARLDKLRKVSLINSISGFKSVNLVGTCDEEGRSNLAVISSTVHLGSEPPLLAMVIRPGGEERHTLANILSTGCYTINHVHTTILEAAHQTAARYPVHVSEFTATGLTPYWQDDFTAPSVAEAHIRLSMQLREHHELEINGTHFVIGEVVGITLPANCLNEDGSLDLAAAGTLALSGLDTYHMPGQIKRMAYPKPDLPPRQVASARDML